MIELIVFPTRAHSRYKSEGLPATISKSTYFMRARSEDCICIAMNKKRIFVLTYPGRPPVVMSFDTFFC